MPKNGRTAGQELYHDELNNLKNFRQKLDTHTIYRDDLNKFSGQYEELLTQAKVITRVSDRLQKKLNNANVQIQKQNEDIKDKNSVLEATIHQLAKARVGKRASTITLTVTLLLFIVEQLFVEPLIEEQVDIPYLDYGILAIIFFVVKGLESSLEKYLLNEEVSKIVLIPKSGYSVS